LSSNGSLGPGIDVKLKEKKNVFFVFFFFLLFFLSWKIEKKKTLVVIVPPYRPPHHVNQPMNPPQGNFQVRQNFQLVALVGVNMFQTLVG